MRKVLFIMLLSFCMMACNGQKKQNEVLSKQDVAADSTLNPKVDVKVNKRFDDKGNLIQYDSTYSYFYSFPGIKGKGMNLDSVFNELKMHNDQMRLLDDDMNGILFSDSLLKSGVFNNEFFSKGFEINRRELENAFRQMDSIKSEMLKRSYPKGKTKEK